MNDFNLLNMYKINYKCIDEQEEYENLLLQQKVFKSSSFYLTKIKDKGIFSGSLKRGFLKQFSSRIISKSPIYYYYYFLR